MKISNISQISNIYQKNSKIKSNSKNLSSSKDDLTLSSQALDYKKAFSSIKKLPDIRQDKVDLISEKIKNGTYNIPIEQVAEKMLLN